MKTISLLFAILSGFFITIAVELFIKFWPDNGVSTLEFIFCCHFLLTSILLITLSILISRPKSDTDKLKAENYELKKKNLSLNGNIAQIQKKYDCIKNKHHTSGSDFKPEIHFKE